METKAAAKFKVSDNVSWSSQGKKKTGEVVAVLGPEDSIQVALEFRFGKGLRIPKSAVKAQDRSSRDRYLVRVLPPAKRRPGAKRGFTDPGPVYYAPLVATLDGKSSSSASRFGAR